MKKILALILMLPIFLSAQELEATVDINVEKLQTINRENLHNFKQSIEDYLNNTKFSGQNWDFDKIQCSFTILFTSAPDEFNYTAQVIVRSLRKVYKSTRNSPMITVNDGNWNFRYERNESLYSNPNIFHPITSFLDYYALLIIAMEQESWEKMAGSDLFSKAFAIANLGANSNFRKGWETGTTYNRFDLVENIQNEKYRTFREAISDYQYGIDIYENQKAKGQEKIVSLIKVLDALKTKIDYRSLFVKTFFDAKSGELIDHLKDYPDKSVFKTLKTIDPPRISKYDEMLKD